MMASPFCNCAYCNDTGKLNIGWIMPYANAIPVYPGEPCPMCRPKADHLANEDIQQGLEMGKKP